MSGPRNASPRLYDGEGQYIRHVRTDEKDAEIDGTIMRLFRRLTCLLLCAQSQDDSFIYFNIYFKRTIPFISSPKEKETPKYVRTDENGEEEGTILRLFRK